MTLEELLKGEATEIKEKSYLTAKQYVEPFIKAVEPYSKTFKIEAKQADQITGGALVFNRVNIEAYAKQTPEGFTEIIGLNYALDTKTPVMKIYRAYKDNAGNMIVPNENLLVVQEIIPGEVLQYPVKSLMEQASCLDVFFKKLEKNFTPKESVELLGKWVINALTAEFNNSKQSVRISSDLVVSGYDSIFLDSSSPYYVIGENFSYLDIYLAMSSQLNKPKDMLNRFEKLAIFKQILNLK